MEISTTFIFSWKIFVNVEIEQRSGSTRVGSHSKCEVEGGLQRNIRGLKVVDISK